ncbi:MAG: hypothetical protein JRG91_08060 [Deltaproteobacteria bacterium]|nr:hypothetical protein [Deltaproteobacteria bacterium]
MLTKFDELTCHQTIATFDGPATSDRAWAEKLWCNVHDTEGKLVLATGFGIYPNRNVIDGFGCVNVHNEVQHNLRLSRELRPRIDEIALGPLSYQVLEPFRRIAIRMDENDRGLSYDIEFIGTFDPGEEEPQFGRSAGRVHVHTCRYAQLGRARGWVEVDGTRFDIDESSHFAQRDHSWGIRMGVGAPEQGVQETDVATYIGMMINWLTVQFEDWGAYLYYIERHDGRVQRLSGSVVGRAGEAKEPIPITGVEHEYTYHDGAPRMKSGHVVLTLADGSTRALEMRELTTMYLRGGAYLGYKGAAHGLWLGPSWSDGESWRLSEPGVTDETHGLNDTVVEVSSDGKKGYGIVENLILPPFPRYGF